MQAEVETMTQGKIMLNQPESCLFKAADFLSCRMIASEFKSRDGSFVFGSLQIGKWVRSDEADAPVVVVASRHSFRAGLPQLRAVAVGMEKQR